MTKKKFGFAQLALCDWLYEDVPEARFVTLSPLLSGRGDLRFHEIKDRNESGLYINRIIGQEHDASDKEEAYKALLALTRRLGGSLSIDYTSLLQSGYVASHNLFNGSEAIERFSAKFDRLTLHHNSNLIRSTKKGREWWAAEGKAQFEAELQKREAKRQRAERKVVIGAWMTITPKLPEDLTRLVSKDIKLPLPTRTVFRPFGTAIVQSQTDKRIGVTQIKPFRKWDQYYTSSEHQVKWPIQGREPNLYISPENIMVDYADDSIGLRLDGLHTEEEAEFRARATTHMSEIIPLLFKMHNALGQQQHALEDMTKDMIESFNSRRADEPKP